LRHVSPEERTGYPTQKPRALLERIILAGSTPGGIIVDLFAGSGTTAAAAAKLGRSFVVGDTSPVALATMRSRLLREGVTPLAIERCGESKARPNEPDATVHVARSSTNEASVTLSRTSGCEPVAWAIDPSRSPSTAFCAQWHAERGSGRHPKPLPLQATIVLGRNVRAIRARVYFVDGTVRDLAATVPAQHHARAPLSAGGVP
jgi:hypothetical protein